MYVSDEEADSPAVLAKHRLVFWPRTKTPLLLITNRRQAARAVYGKIRVLGLSADAHNGTGDVGQSADGRLRCPRRCQGFTRSVDAVARRLLDRPLFTENFSAPNRSTIEQSPTVEIRQPSIMAPRGCVEYLNYTGFGGLMLSVVADGSAIYP